MENIDYLMIVLVLITVYLVMKRSNEGLSANYTDSEKNNMANRILANRNMFTNQSWRRVLSTMSFMDPVLYEDIRLLINNNSLTKNNIMNLL